MTSSPPLVLIRHQGKQTCRRVCYANTNSCNCLLFKWTVTLALTTELLTFEVHNHRCFPLYCRICTCANPLFLWAGSDGCSFGPVVSRNPVVLDSNRGRDWYLSSGLCIYSAPNWSKAWNVPCCLWYRPTGTLHYKKLLMSFNKSRAHSRLRASFCRDIVMIVQKGS